MRFRRRAKRVEPRWGGALAGLRLMPEDRPAAPPAGRHGRQRKAAAGRKGSGRRAGRRSGAPSRRLRLSPFRLFRRTLYWGAVASLWTLIAAVGVVAWYGLQLPHASSWTVPERPPNVRILSASGELIGHRGETAGEAVRLGDLPVHVGDAVVAIEDRRFRSHFGLDPIGLMRAALRNLLAGRLVEGGSTITQQLAKNLFLTPERSFRRKVQELVLAMWLEARYSKDAILEMYLNRVYFGAGAYGVDAAARRYYDRPAGRVTLAQAAVLAGLLRAPSYYAPDRHPERAAARAATVLAVMAEEGLIGEAERRAATEAPARVVRQHLARSENYVADWVMDRLPAYVGAVEQDIVVETTIDLGLQQAAERALVDALQAEGERYDVGQGALVAIDPTGAVRALVGGRDYAASQFNRATQARRQPGSAFKPFVYLTALEHGLTPDDVRTDGPVKIGSWQPENYSRDYRGPVTLREALAQSLNTVAARLTAEVGPANVARTAQRLGIDSPLNANATIALGTSEVSLLELTGAYAAFANGGFAAHPQLISRIRTADGAVIFERAGIGIERVVSLEHVAQMNDMLRTTLERGTGRRASIPGWPAAGKTGTSQAFRDAWFVGYTAHLTVGVWVGNDSGAPTRRASGGNLPATIWSSFMDVAHRGLPVADLPGATLVATRHGGRPTALPEARPEEAAWRGSQGGERTLLDLILGR
ncbi:MAG TPA: PBP1A family penicillin-binding protein [Afifellaceae bacterium]|nr:PBP1A family penicillin-binding protein [Afifellaceae bacterium]